METGSLSIMPNGRESSWRLVDATVIAKASPYTFYKPSAQAVSLLHPGNLVKLIFEFDSNDFATPGAERMWVRIDRIEGVLLNRAMLEGANFISDADAELLAESLPGPLHAEPGGRKLGSVEILRLRLK